MRILLISPNMEKLPDPVAPLGLAYLASALKFKGYEVKCLDLCFAENWEETIAKSILRFFPEAIGLSLRNVDNVSYPDTVSYLPFYKEVVRRCRKFSSSPLFFGGAGFTLMPEAIIKYLDADGGIIGEGEEAFPKVLMGLTNDFSAAIEGFLSRNLETPARPACIQDLDSLPLPDWDSLDLKKYFSRGGMGNLQSKRGCPFSCIYCTYPLIEGKKVRLRSPSKVARDAEDLIQRGVKNAFMVDNIFNFPESHAHDVCQALVEKRIFLQWSCYAHPSYFSPALAEDMKMAGCTGVEFGTDSGAPQVLAKLGKKFNPEDIRQATRLAREAGLEICHSLSLGAPGETAETLKETFSLMEEISPTAVIAMLGLRIFPGTGLAHLAEKEGMISASHDFLQPTFYISPEVEDKVVELAREKAKDHPNWIFPGLGINVSSRLQTKLRKLGIKGPLWEHMKIMRERRAAKKETHV
ncbi:MAG: radical SAM protein [Thermodesulfobacteriota bacterium]|nr:radical SAM protein [Thermodesulfobacteriota bacterium]